jgi:excisionase family DNA binding protein
MAKERDTRRSAERREPAAPPIPLSPLDLLAGIAPGLELHADELPSSIDVDAADEGAATMTVAEAGKILRCGDATIRRLIRTAVLRPIEEGDGPRLRRQEVEDLARAGVLPRSRERPGE